MEVRIQETITFCYQGKAQIVNTNRKLLVKKHSSKWETACKMNRGRPGNWHIPGPVVEKARTYKLSAVLSRRLLLCCAMLTVHSSHCHLPCGGISQLPTPGARSLEIYYERCSMFLTPTLHAVIVKHPTK